MLKNKLINEIIELEERIDELEDVIHQQDLEYDNLMVELKYNRMAVKYLRDTNKHLLEIIKELKGDK